MPTIEEIDRRIAEIEAQLGGGLDMGNPISNLQAIDARIAEIEAQLGQSVGAAQPTPGTSQLEAGLRGAAQGLTLGFGDEASSAVQALVGSMAGRGQFGELYTAAHDYYSGEREKAREAYPKTFIGGEIAGSLLPTVAAPAGLAARGAGTAARLLGAPLARTAAPAARVAQQVGTGAGLGAVYGAGTAAPGERARGAAVGGAIGGVGGAAASGLGAAASRLAAPLARRSAAQTAAQAGLPEGTTPEAIQEITSALRAEGAFDAPTQANRIIDVGQGPRSLADAAARRTPEAQQTILEGARAGTDEAGAAFFNKVDEIFGRAGGHKTQSKEAVDLLQQTRANAYNRAYAVPLEVDKGPGKEVVGILQSMAGTRAFQYAKRAANEDLAIAGKQPIPDDLAAGVSVEQIDRLTRGLREMAYSLPPGEQGGDKFLAATIKAKAGEARNVLRQAFPDFDEAVDISAQGINARHAQQLGYDIVRGKVSADDIAVDYPQLTKYQVEHIKTGIRNAMQDVADETQDAITNPVTESKEALKVIQGVTKPKVRKAMAAAIGGKETDDLFDAIKPLRSAYATRAAVAENSKTAIRQQIIDRFEHPRGKSLFEDVGSLSVPGIAAGGVRQFFGASPRRLGDRTASSIAPALFASPANIRALIQRPSPQRTQDLTRLLSTLATRSAIPPATSSTNDRLRLRTLVIGGGEPRFED